MPSQEGYSDQWEQANQAVQTAINAAQEAHVALEQARASQIAYEVQHAEMEFQKALQQVKAAQQHLPYVSSQQQMDFSQAEQLLNEEADSFQ